MKYIITKADGSPVDPSARYFVLRVDGANSSPERDIARNAVKDYASNIRDINREASDAAYRALSGFPNVTPYAPLNDR